MPNYDLSSANLGRVAGQTVDVLRIANQTVWDVSEPIDELYSIFGESAISSLGSFDDLHANAYVANQFHRPAGVVYEILDVGLYIPSGSSLIGREGDVGVMLKSTPYAPSTLYANTMAMLGGPTESPLVAGWNWHTLPAPVVWAEGQPYALGGYSIDTHYLYNSTLSENVISSAGLEFDLAPTNADGMWRSWYTRQSDGQFEGTSARSYGIDLRIRIPDQRLLRNYVPPSNNNPGLYNYGFRFSRTTAFKALGAYWYYLSADGPTSVTARLYNATTQAVLASKTLSTSGFVNATWNKIPFDAPYTGAPSTQYIITVEANGRGGFDSGSILPQTEAGFTVHEGRYQSGGGFPENTWTGLHGVGLNWKESD